MGGDPPPTSAGAKRRKNFFLGGSPPTKCFDPLLCRREVPKISIFRRKLQFFTRFSKKLLDFLSFDPIFPKMQLVLDTMIPTVVLKEIHLDHPPWRLVPDGLTASRPKRHGHHPFLPIYLIWSVVCIKGTIKIDIYTQQTLSGLKKTKISEKFGKKKKQ